MHSRVAVSPAAVVHLPLKAVTTGRRLGAAAAGHRPRPAALLLAAALAALPAAPAPGADGRLVREGVAVALDVEPLETGDGGLREGAAVRFRFTISDVATGQPLAGLYPAAWMSLLGDDEAPDGGRCVKKVEEFVAGSILMQPELDLNAYYVLALNHDATITVVDPLFGFGGTKLLALLELPTPGEDWALSADQSRLFVSLPISHRVAVADTAGWKVESYLDAGPRPTRLAFQPDGAYLWVTIEGADRTGDASGVAALDPRRERVANRISTGPGPHELAFSDDSRFVFVTNAGAGTVSVIDVHALEEVAELATGDRPVSVAYSPLARTAYVTHEGDGTIVAIDGERHVIVGRMKAEPGLGQIRVAPGGRLAFAVNPRTDSVSIVDTASQRIVQIGDLMPEPDQIAFSDELAYIRHRRSEIVLMIPLDEVGEEGKPVHVIDFPGGQHPFGMGSRPSPADAIVQAPGANAVLVANPADQVIYYYKEGMAAPMGAFKNYDRQPRAVLVVDRSLRERTRPGTYETSAKLRRPGRYEVAFFLDSPRIVHCSQVAVAPDPELERRRRAARPAEVEPLLDADTGVVGQAMPLRFRLKDPHTGEPAGGLRDVQVLVYTSGSWNRREPAAEVGEGVYEVSFLPPAPGTYRVAIECRSQRLLFHQSPPVVLFVTPP